MADIEFIEPQAARPQADHAQAPGSEPDLVIVDADVAAPHAALCPACGAPVESHDRFCPACGCPVEGAEQAPPATAAPEMPAPGTPAAAAPAAQPPQQRFFRCQNCGAEVATDPDQRSYVCTFCDSTYVVEFSPETSGRQPPEFVIGFAVTPEQAREKFRRWISENSWFRPGDLKTGAVEEKQRGVYLPFWSFSMLARSRWSASIGEYWYRTETYTTTDEKGNMVTKTRQVRETEWWPLSGRHHRYYSGYLVSGSRGLPQQQAERIKPFQLPALKRYEPFYLAGWLCEEYSVAREEALRICQQVFYQQEQRNVGGFLPGDTYRSLQVATDFSSVNSDLCLLPVYILSYRYRKKLYRFLINGQTGKVAGDKPLSWRRIAVAVGCVIGAIAAVVLLILGLSLIVGRH